MSFAFVFPGQGSQSVGMMSVYGAETVVRATFDEASNALGEDLWGLVMNGPSERLSETRNTQPVMLTAGIAVWRLWGDKGGHEPTVLAGHSLGEYSALVASGVIGFSDAVCLVRLRAEAMQEAVPAGVGAMAAVLGLDDISIASACQESAQGECVQAVNYNAIGQTVIAGHKNAVDRAAVACKARGAKRVAILPVSAPFHSALMMPAADKLAARLEQIEFSQPKIALINNVDVSVEVTPSRIRDALVRQAYSPVRWVETVQKMASMGVTAVFECGPGKVLAGLTKRCSDSVSSYALSDLAAVESALASLEQ